MPRLRLLVLGPPRVELDDAPTEITRNKALALLVYLALTGQSHSRDALATMLWPEADQSRARTALRRVLSDLKQALGKELISTPGEMVSLQPKADLWVDALAFQSQVRASQSHVHPAEMPCEQCIARLTQAVSIYRDDLLAGFTLPDSPAFDEWQFFQAEAIRRDLAVCLEQLVQGLTLAGRIDQALAYARRWCAIDPLLEAPQRALIKLYAWTGQRAAAIRQYGEYTRLLKEELSSTPGDEIAGLIERIKRGEEPARTKEAESVSTQEPAPLSSPSPLPAERDEIRLVTILFAGHDASDSALDNNPEKAADSADALLSIVSEFAARYQAHPSPFLGEGVQVVFGIPQMHEDDAERAVHAALDIREQAARQGLGVKIGVTTGRVYWGAKGTTGTLQVAAIGPVVNLAARLHARAAAGQVLVSEATFRHTRRAFDFAPRTVDIGGPAGVAKVYEARRALPRPDKARGIEGMRPELVGREEELARLESALDSVLAGRGGMIGVIGEAGIGKSRLITELKRQALASAHERPRFVWLASRCSEFGGGIPYYPFIDLLDMLFNGHADAQSDTEREQALVSFLHDLADGGHLLGGQKRLEEMVPYLSNLMSIRSRDELSQRFGEAHPEQVQHQTFLAVHDLFVALARRRPLVIVLEDLHWADALSLDLVAFLAEAVLTNPILLVGVYRPEQQLKLKRLSSWAMLKLPVQYTELVLRELSPAQSARLVESMLGADVLAPAVQDLILKRASGNPFFIEETVRALIDSGALYSDENGWQARPNGGGVTVAESIQSVIQSRVDRLEPDAKRVLHGAAVIGRQFQVQILARVIPPSIDLDQTLNRLEEAALVYQERIVPEVEYLFKHALVQQAVYETLARQQREELHRLVAEAIEQRHQGSTHEHYEELAYHYSHSPSADKAIEYLVKAGAKSRRAFLNDQAIRYFEQALERMDAGTAHSVERFTALAGLGQIYHLKGQGQAAEEYLRQAVEVGDKTRLAPRALARLYYWLGEVLHWQGRYGEQVRLGEAGLALLGDDKESIEAALMNQMIAGGSIRRGDRDQFYLRTGQTAQFIQRLPHSEELASLYRHIVFSLSDQKEIEHIPQWLEEIERLADQQRDLYARAVLDESRSQLALERGDLAGAALHLDQALQSYAQTGDSINTWRCQSGMAWIRLLCGELTKAETHARTALDIAASRGFDRIISESHLDLGIVLLAQGLWDQAIGAFEQSARFATGADPFWTKWAAPYCQGCAHLAQGKKELALQSLQTAMTLFSPQLVPLGWEQHRWWPVSACILGKLEAIYPQQEAFIAFCRNWEEFQAQHAMPPIPMQWYAEPSEPDTAFSNPKELSWSIQNGEWLWRDPFGDCSYIIRDGVEIHAANGRDLWRLNTSAPRLVRPAARDLLVQTTIPSPPDNLAKPSIGGLVLWRDAANWLRLVWGNRGERDLAFEGCIDNEDVIVGRGLLPELAAWPRVYLRMEKRGDQVKALGSVDGQTWYSLGQVAFPVADPIEVGLHAVGWIDRTVYSGAYPDGTMIRFESFELWTDPDTE